MFLGESGGAARLLEHHSGERRRSYSSAVSRPPAEPGPGGSRAEPLLRGAFREKVDYSNLNRRPGRMPVYGPGLREKPAASPWSLRATATGNFHCRPTLDI